MKGYPTMLCQGIEERGRLLRGMLEFAVAAGGVFSDYRRTHASPSSAAEQAAEAVISAGLAHAAPAVPVIWGAVDVGGELPDIASMFFLVDALDGVQEYLCGGTDYTVNIGLIDRGVPTLGVVYAPGRSTVYWGDALAGKAWRASQAPHAARSPATRISVTRPTSALRAVASELHSTPETEAWLQAASVRRRLSIGSSLKFVLIAAGEADVYPGFTPTMEWDTAAGDAVLRAAGGRVLDLDGESLMYGKPRFFNPGLLATGLYEPAAFRPFVD